MEKKQKVIVTGGSRGIGRAIVKEFAAENTSNFSHIAFIYNSCDECAEEIKKELSNSEVKVISFKSDVSSYKDAQIIVDKIASEFGGIDVLVNNAGITRDNLLLRMSEEDFDQVIKINLKSVFNYTKASLKYMIQQRYGRIINISSVVGLIGNAGQANYAASKAGIVGFTKATAREVASRGITVNAIAPGYIETDMTSKLNDKQRETLLTAIPIKRLGRPEDVAKLVLFLADEKTSYITGQVIAVDGGMTM
ncbi:3-oxoacyl-[acyl-carrier-protein] reductase [Melioribacteraceae bacterium 4301-Me]|uniref:3-oxoacyl-[acyl-carrier-protein] reductase n=1 Tax=Pyranulibacter aquaticus TaxID=3163344 RepID=UPI00359B30F4